MTPNSLFLNRLVIHTRNGKIAYDEMYHRGVNIICGDNSSGKSTITHFIFYVLGGAFNDWVKEAKLCSAVEAEVEMNSAVLVIRREININEYTHKGNDKEPVHIFWGSYAESQKSPMTEWQKFGYLTTEDKKSFSNIFFDNLNLPIVRGEGSNITIHQILRLLYVDQDSPTSSLFLYEQFDTTLTRETVSDLLLGVYSEELYDYKQRLIQAINEHDDVKRQIKGIKQFVPNELDLVPANLRTKIDNKEKEIEEIEAELIRLNVEGKAVRFTQATKLDFEKLSEETHAQRVVVSDLESQIRSLKYEIDDTEFFVEVLEGKVKSVKNSILTREFLGEFPLEYCPECLTELTKSDNHTHCKLCKEPIDSNFGITQARKIEQELSFQIKESRSLLILRKKEISEKKVNYDSEKLKLHSLQARVNLTLKDVKSVREEKVNSLYVDKGFHEGEILQLRTLLENAEKYQDLIKARDMLGQEIDVLGAKISAILVIQEAQKESINSLIEKKALYLLNNDLKRQAEFIEAKEFTIDYRNNLAFISDKDAKYSASSNFYLKTTARFAIFLASVEIDQMRYPRFILCDNMEDKGIEERRAQNFQNIVIDEAMKHDPNTFQMIYTTAVISPELRDSPYRVGEYYTKDSHSLKNVG